MRVNCRIDMASYCSFLCFFFFASATILRAAESVPLATQAQPPPAVSLQGEAGAITLPARDAITHGTQMHYEPSPVKNCLGYWFKTEDWAEWEFKVTRPGAFEAEVWQGCGQGQGGSEVALEVGTERFTFAVEETGHFQIFLPRRIGRVTFAAGTYRLALKPQRKQASAIMDVRQIKLLPVESTLQLARQFP